METNSSGYLAMSQHIYKAPSGLIRQTEIVHARWESGKLILEQWTVNQTYKADMQLGVLTHVA